MYRRQSIVMEVLKAFSKGLRLYSMKVKDQDKDESCLRKMFQRRGEKVGISKDPDGESLWFKHK